MNDITWQKTGWNGRALDELSLEEEYLSSFREEGRYVEGVLSLMEYYGAIYFADDPACNEKKPFFEKYLDCIRNAPVIDTSTQGKNILLESLLLKEYGEAFALKPFQMEWKTLNQIEIEEAGGRSSRYEDLIILPEGADIYVIGDSHGDRYSVGMIVSELIKFPEMVGKDRNTFLVFAGDYVSNGLNSIGEMEFILTLKDQFPQNVILLNGNHDFKETWLTCFKESFYHHWNSFKTNSFVKAPPFHYGHFRYDLSCRYGVESGERIYSLFSEWGAMLPYIVVDRDKELMISHSIGKTPEIDRDLTLEDLVYGKQNDREKRDDGEFFSSFKGVSQHRAMVHNREFNDQLLGQFHQLGFEHFLVGHCHFKSRDCNSGLITICSSCTYSPDAGHYMYQEMKINRKAILESPETGPCYVHFGKVDKKPNIIPFTTQGIS